MSQVGYHVLPDGDTRVHRAEDICFCQPVKVGLHWVHRYPGGSFTGPFPLVGPGGPVDGVCSCGTRCDRIDPLWLCPRCDRAVVPA